MSRLAMLGTTHPRVSAARANRHDRPARVRWGARPDLLAAGAALLAVSVALGGCTDEETAPPDVTAPVTTATIEFPQGGSRVIEGTTFRLAVREVTLVLEADEPATIYFSLDDSTPTPAGPSTSAGGQRSSIRLVGDPEDGGRARWVVRWFASDRSGNSSAARRVEVLFDLDAPTMVVTPEGGDFDGPVDVRIEADEPTEVFWSTDGSMPVADAPGVESDLAPVEIRLSRTTQLSVIGRDTAGNSTRVIRYTYTIDSTPPRSFADPPGGRFTGPLTVALLSDDPDATIRYTTDGSEPGDSAAVYGDPIPIESDTSLRFRAFDRGGNAEPVQEAAFTFGGLVGPPRPDGSSELLSLSGGLDLAAVVLESAGALSGLPGTDGGIGRDWPAWALGRTVVEALSLQTGSGIHGMHAPRIEALAPGLGVADAGNDGSVLDDAYHARLDALAEAVGAARPVGMHPAFIFYRALDTRLLRVPTRALLDDGRPEWALDFAWMLAVGAPAPDRSRTPASLAAAVRALAARAGAESRATHAQTDGDAAAVMEAVGLRCAGCHAGAASTRLDSAAAVAASSVVVSGDAAGSALPDLLTGAAPHPGGLTVDPVTPEQAAFVRAWIDAGADAGGAADPTPAVGGSAEGGFFALLAIEQATWALDGLLVDGVYDRDTEALGALPAGDADGRHYAPDDVLVTEGFFRRLLPRQVERYTLRSARMDTAAHAALLDASVALWEVVEARGLGRWLANGQPGAADVAERVAQFSVGALLGNTFDAELGVFRAGAEAGGAVEDVDVAAAADAATALLRARPDGPDLGRPVAEEAAQVVDFLLRNTRDPAGAFVERWNARADRESRRTLATQMAALRMLLAAVEGGDTRARDAAVELWDHLRTGWYDASAGAWQSEFGGSNHLYTPALAARVLETVRMGIGTLPGAREAAAAFFDAVVVPMTAAEHWLAGEASDAEADDADGDGITKPRAAGGDSGRSPVFHGAVVFRD